MKTLHLRLAQLDREGKAYELDFVTMTTGYVYRRCPVLRHSEHSIFVRHDGDHETYLNTDEIVSARIVLL